MKALIIIAALTIAATIIALLAALNSKGPGIAYGRVLNVSEKENPAETIPAGAYGD